MGILVNEEFISSIKALTNKYMLNKTVFDVKAIVDNYFGEGVVEGFHFGYNWNSDDEGGQDAYLCYQRFIYDGELVDFTEISLPVEDISIYIESNKLEIEYEKGANDYANPRYSPDSYYPNYQFNPNYYKDKYGSLYKYAVNNMGECFNAEIADIAYVCHPIVTEIFDGQDIYFKDYSPITVEEYEKIITEFTKETEHEKMG